MVEMLGDLVRMTLAEARPHPQGVSGEGLPAGLGREFLGQGVQ